MKLEELKRAIRAKARERDDFYSIVGIVSGFGAKRVREIARGKGADPSFFEIDILSSLAVMK
jgi:hypothetical protein